jgi:uncharacterized membrane protein YeiH
MLLADRIVRGGFKKKLIDAIGIAIYCIIGNIKTGNCKV